MIQRIENFVFNRAAPLAIRHIGRPDLQTQDRLAALVLKQARVEFQVAPPLTVHFIDPDLMAGVWHALRESYVVNAKSRALREVAATTISGLNQCPYCETVHASMFASAGGDAALLETPRQLPPEIATAKLWAAATLSPGSAALKHPLLTTAEIPQIFATAVMFHYVNRVVSVFLADTPAPVPGIKSGFGQKILRRLFAMMSNRITLQDPTPGAAAWQVAAELPDEFDWARANPAVANGLAHFALVCEAAGKEAVPADVQALVIAHLHGWKGEGAPLSRRWVEDWIAELKDKDKSAGRLALLTARAAFQVDDGVIAAFQADRPGDKALVQTVAWAAFAASCRIGSWFEV